MTELSSCTTTVTLPQCTGSVPRIRCIFRSPGRKISRLPLALKKTVRHDTSNAARIQTICTTPRLSVNNLAVASLSTSRTKPASNKVIPPTDRRAAGCEESRLIMEFPGDQGRNRNLPAYNSTYRKHKRFISHCPASFSKHFNPAELLNFI